jgi:hypothetical protein
MHTAGSGKKQPPRAGQVNKVKALDPGDIIVKKEGSALKSSSSRFLNVGPQEKLERLPKIKCMYHVLFHKKFLLSTSPTSGLVFVVFSLYSLFNFIP